MESTQEFERSEYAGFPDSRVKPVRFVLHSSLPQKAHMGLSQFVITTAPVKQTKSWEVRKLFVIKSALQILNLGIVVWVH